MKRFILLGAVVVLTAGVVGCSWIVPLAPIGVNTARPPGVFADGPQFLMKAWDRNSHEKLGEWCVYRDCWGRFRTVDNDAEVKLGQATIILEQIKPPLNRIVLRQRSEDDR